MAHEENFLDLNLNLIVRTSPEQQPKSQQISDENLDYKAHSTQLFPRSVDKHKLTWMSNLPCKKKIHKCQKGTFFCRNLSGGLKNLAGLKSHLVRKHMPKTFNCPKRYTVQPEHDTDLWKCGSGSKTCVCGKVFPRGKYEYMTHKLWCPVAREAETKLQPEIKPHQLNYTSLQSNSFGAQQLQTPVFEAPRPSPPPPPLVQGLQAQHFFFQNLNRLAQVEMLNQNSVSANHPFMGFSLESPNFVGNRGFTIVNNFGFRFL